MPLVTRRTSHVTELLLIAMAIIWGVNFPVVKYGTQVLEPLAYNAARMTLGAVVLLAIAFRRSEKRPSTSDKWKLMGLGVLGHCIYQLLFVHGIAITKAGTASLVVAASPAIVALVARAFGYERLPMRALIGIALSIGGVLLVLGGSVADDGDANVLGDAMILFAVIVWAFYTTWLVPMTKRVEAVQIAAWTLLGGVIPLIVFAIPSLLRTDWIAIAPLTWLAIAYSGLLAMVVAYLFWYRGVNEIGATRTAMFGNLQPIVAVLVAWGMLGEIPTLFQGAGAAAVLGGLWLARH